MKTSPLSSASKTHCSTSPRPSPIRRTTEPNDAGDRPQHSAYGCQDAAVARFLCCPCGAGGGADRRAGSADLRDCALLATAKFLDRFRRLLGVSIVARPGLYRGVVP